MVTTRTSKMASLKSYMNGAVEFIRGGGSGSEATVDIEKRFFPLMPQSSF